MYDFLFFKQKTAYEMRISDWSSDVCSSDLLGRAGSIGGAIWAAVVITVMPQFLSWLMRAMDISSVGYGAGLENIVLGLILAHILLKAPQRFYDLLRAGSRK